MKHLFIPYVLAVIAKEKGFDEPCLAWYCNDMNLLYSNMYAGNTIEDGSAFMPKPKQLEVYAPLYQQIVDWLRQRDNINIILYSNKSCYFGFKIINIYNNKVLFHEKPIASTYRYTFNKAIEEAFKIIEGISNLPHNQEEN